MLADDHLDVEELNIRDVSLPSGWLEDEIDIRLGRGLVWLLLQAFRAGVLVNKRPALNNVCHVQA